MGQIVSRPRRRQSAVYNSEQQLNIKEIVNILITDKVLISNWQKLFDGLNLKAEEYKHLERQVNNSTIKGYELFSTILTQWLSAEGSNATTDVLQRVLEENGFREVAEKLQDRTRISEIRQKDAPIWFEVGKGTSHFVGRSKELDELRRLYKSQKSVLVVTTTGMGGVGKSELVNKFAKEISETDSASCIWLNGETRESLKNSVIRLIDLVKPFELDANQPLEVQFCHVVSSIKIKTRILVIIDNVDDANEDVQKLISKIPSDRCFFLVTSRNVGVLEYAGTIIQLDILTNEAAIDLIKQSEIDDPETEIMKLCILLGNFPLALQQAAAFIKMQKHSGDEAYKISDYLKIYEMQKITLLGYRLNHIEHEYKDTTLITWNISLEKIRKNRKFGDLAIELLNTIAYFEPDGIHVDFLNLYQPDLKETILLIKTYSLVKFQNGVLSIHRLVQQAMRLKLSSDQLEISQLTKIILSIQPILETAEQFVGLHGDFGWAQSSKVRRLLKHIENGMVHIVSVLKHAAKHAELINTFKNVLLKTLDNLRYFMIYQQIIDLCHATSHQLKEISGGNTVFKLRIESELAYAQIRLHRENEFNENDLIELGNIYGMQLSIFGEADESTLTTAHYIVQIHERHQQRFSDEVKTENVQFCRNVVELKTKVFGPCHKSTLSTKRVLAQYLFSVEENYLKAVKLYEECFHWQLTHLGPDGSDTYKIFNRYVKLLLNTDNCEEARCVVEQHMKQDLKESKHNVYKDLSLVLFCLEQMEEAFFMLRRAISIQNIDEEISQFDANFSKYNDADALLKDGNYSEALKFYKNFDIFVYTCGWWWADVQYKISQCLIGLHDLKEAQKVLEISRNVQSNELGNHCKPVIQKNKLLDEINRKIKGNKLNRFRRSIHKFFLKN